MRPGLRPAARLATVAALLLSLAGCMAGPDYRKAVHKLPQGWTEAPGTPAGDARPGQPWWKAMEDPVLERLMERAASGNLDLKAALARIKLARAAERGAFAQLMPSSSGSVQTSRGDQNSRDPYQPQSQLTAALNFSWEIDLFGGNRRELEARQAEGQASLAARDATLLAMSLDLARAYVLYRDAQGQLASLAENVAVQADTASLILARHKAGLASALEVSQAERQLAATRALEPPLTAQKAQALHRMELLCGVQSGELGDLAGTMPAPGLARSLKSPGAVIATRPDVAQAERQFAAATARQGVSRAAWLPRISLSALLGTVSASPDTMFLMSGQTWSFGGNLLQTLFDFGRIKAQIRASDAQAELAAVRLEQAVLTALAETETALAVALQAERRRLELANVRMRSEETFGLARARFLAGLASFLDVLDAQRALVQSTQELRAAEAQTARAYVDLQGALGGETFAAKPEPGPDTQPLFQFSPPARIIVPGGAEGGSG